MKKTSDIIGELVNQNLTKAAARQEGDTKIGKDGVTRYWTRLSSGKYDWRKNPPKGSSGQGGAQQTQNKVQKLRATLKKKDVADLEKYARGHNNDPTLRQESYNELVARGEDVSKINLNTGKFKAMKEAFGGDGSSKKNSSKKTATATDGDSVDDIVGGDDEPGMEEDWRNPDFIKKQFGGLKTKRQRIEADAFIHSQKTAEDGYIEPQKEIHSLNRTYAQFFATDSPLMIASGGAGVGKSYNMHLVAEHMGNKAFNGETDEPGDDDYDYVEAPEVKSDTQLVSLLKEHNGKTIVFDDSDNVLKQSDTMGIMKKATASSGKRILGKKSSNKSTNVDPFEFTGKILFLTNMGQHDLTKNEHLNAIYTRAIKKDLNFTKREKLEMMEILKHKTNFTGVERLENKADDIQEREEVFDMIKDNIDAMDPDKFSSRTFMEALVKKRAVDNSNAMIESDPTTASLIFGEEQDWKEEVGRFLKKGITLSEEKGNDLQKALTQLGLN